MDLTQIMLNLKESITVGANNILPDALWLLGALGAIELALALILNKDEDPLIIITHKFIKFSFFAWFVQNWIKLTKQWFDMFQYFGVKMALGVGGSDVGVNDPSAILEQGIYLSLKLSNSILQISTGAGVTANLIVIVFKILALIVIVTSFAFMALQLFITCLEFYLTATLTLPLIPFSVNKHTAFIGEKAIGAIISFCIKIMVIQFILCISIPFAKTWAQIDVVNNDFLPLYRAVFGCVGLAYISWKSPQFIQGMLSGSPSLHGGDAIGGARAVAGATGSAVGSTVGAVATGMRVAGYSRAAMNAPGGRNSNGSTNWGGVASNMGTMMRGSMPDQAAQMEGKSLFARSTALAKENDSYKKNK